MPNKDVQISVHDLVQSEFTYVQAVGSDGSDGSTTGVHLRWAFRGLLGENHLPKGNLAQAIPYQTTIGFNKPEDFVCIYRVPYTVKHVALVDFNVQVPDRLTEAGALREWEFDVTITSIIGTPEITTVLVRFNDTAQYDSIRTSVDPNTNPLSFVKQYTGIMEVEAKDKLSFSICLNMVLTTDTDPGCTRMESVTEEDGDFVVTCRKKFTKSPGGAAGDDVPIVEETAFLKPDDADEAKLIAENIKYVRFDYQDAYPAQIRVETYHDFILGAANHKRECWEKLGQFSLSIDEAEVFNRLDNTAIGVNNSWARFNDEDPGTGTMTVNVQNYQDKWNSYATGENDNLETGVKEYLTLSVSDLQANKIIAADNAPGADPNTAQMQVSVLQMLNLTALDYHIARMLGLGHVDPEPGLGNQQFIYLMQYETRAPLEANGVAQPVTHYYMTLPTGKNDQRLPLPPVLKPVEYGLLVPGLPDPIELTGPGGYAPFESVRYIRLFKEPETIVTNQFLPFYDTPTEFCLAENTQSVLFGIEYKPSLDPDYVIPELSFDENYQDLAGNFETMPLAADADPTKPIFIHDEREEGKHKYALYGINWFSRVSLVGNEEETDETIFPKLLTLLPPSNMQAQLIQKEAPLLFSTSTEQQLLADISPTTGSDDEILVRLTFSWNQIQNVAHQKADKAEFFFREEPPIVVRGEVTAVTNLPDNKVEVSVGSYVTVSNGETVTPIVPAGEESKFAASLFSVDGTNYMVESVTNSGGLKFTLLKNEETEMVESPLNSNNFISTQTFDAPAVGDIFMCVENLSAITSWPNNQLVKTVDIINYETDFNEDGTPAGSPKLHEETTTFTNGTTRVETIGGIFDVATISDVLDVEGDTNGNPVNIPGSKTGVYRIEFDTYQLTPHPDADVDFYRGTVRVKVAGSDEKRALDVWEISEDTNGNLILLAYDATFNVDASYNPVGAYEPIEVGISKMVNFHPGYRAYFYEESIAGGQNVDFNKAAILPGQGDGTRQTFITARSVDSSISCESAIATPVLIIALEIVAPEPPGEPQGPLFATRPGYDGKSTYTFDTEVNTDNREPFALVFYRANTQSVLEQLYDVGTNGTLQMVREELENLSPSEAVWNNSRWNGLVNADVDGNNEFINYSGATGGFQFPIPDNPNYVIPDANPDNPKVKPFDGVIPPGDTGIIPGTELIREGGITMHQAVKEAIEGAFLSMTEEPVVYQQIDDGYQTSNRKPTLRNQNGDRLAPDNPDFDPAPMAVVYPDKATTAPAHNVRFTDYTLDGANIHQYFYFAVEMSNRFQFGPRGRIAGPVRLVNALPPDTPEIIKVSTELENPLAGTKTEVKFEVNEYLPADKISKLQVYRALNESDALSLRSMKPIKEIPFVFTGETGDDPIVDDFADLEFPPYGDPIYYRLVGIREILNEQDELEDIPSLPSSLIIASIVDMVSPNAPSITFTVENVGTVAPRTLQGVTLSWGKVTHNATYRLYKDSGDGNFELIHEVASNDSLMFYDAGDLEKEDDDGNLIYHKYKVDVENSSGLLNITDNILTI